MLSIAQNLWNLERIHSALLRFPLLPSVAVRSPLFPSARIVAKKRRSRLWHSASRAVRRG
jgi:hypothetical protein